MTTARNISQARAKRKAAGWSLAKAAVIAGVSEPTARVWEANPGGVTEESQRKLEPVYAQFPDPAA